jgi:two-component system chemotaxis response regulator CheB
VPGHDIIVIGASSGGVEALATLVGGWPDDLPAAVFVVLHVPPTATSMLPRILERHGPLPARHARDGEPIREGTILVAPPDRHLLVLRDRVRVIRGPRENRHRPAVDPLFRSAAYAYGPRVIGGVLSGALDDGAAGLRAIKRRGGLTVVQEPAEALFPGMPESALAHVAVDHCLPAAELGPLLARLAREPAPEEGAFPVPRDLELEVQRTARGWRRPDTGEPVEPPGNLTPLSCPECGGPIWEQRDGDLVRFRCQTGHAFTAESMLDGQADAVEEALWAALNTLQENVRLSRSLADDARLRAHTRVAARLDERADEAARRARVIQRVLENGKLHAAAPASDERRVASDE